MWMNDSAQKEYASQLISSLPKELDAVVRTTGGAEANEKALLLARFITGRKKIIGFTDTYHGHSYGTISIGYRPEYTLKESPVVPEFIHMDYPVSVEDDKKDAVILSEFLVKLEKFFKNEDIAAIVIKSR